MRDDIDNVNRFFMPPELLKKRPSRKKLKRIRRRRLIRRTITLSVIVIAVIVLAVSFTNLGCDVIFTLAKNYFSDNMKMNLKAESVTGNPLKGYTFRNIELEYEDGNKILSAESLTGYLNISSLLKGRLGLSEIFTRGVSLDANEFVNALQDMNLNYEATNTDMIQIFTSPAFAEESHEETEHANIIHLDRLRIINSKIHSRFVTMNISSINADFGKFKAEIDADINGLALKGNIDLGNDSELTSINRADMTLGTGKITAVGGLFGDNIFDIHATAEDLNLKELISMFPDVLISGDFNGGLNFNLDVTGTKESPRVFGSIDYKGTKIYALPVERMSANYNYAVSDNMLMMNNIQASVISIPVQGEISATNLFSDDAAIKIKLDGSEMNLEKLDKLLNIPELKSLEGKIDMFNVNINGSMKSLNGLVNLSVPKITYNGRTLSDIKIQLKLAGSNTANVDGKFSFENANGFINGSIESLLRGSRMNLTAKIADLDIKRVENIIPDYPNYNLSGNITLSLSVRGRISEPVITGSLSSNEFNVRSWKVVKPVINFTVKDRTLTIDKTEGTINRIPIAITGTLKPFPSSNPELDIIAGINGRPESSVKITGMLNNPSINLMAMSEKKASPDIKNESRDITPRIEVEIEIASPEIKSREIEIVITDININQNMSNEITSEDTKAKIKEALSKDENAAN
ncbi:MAG: hypothetical protein IJR43_11950 [Synergistaceae bacterium]|nr:hypothetical protein [Synergistaceae bacterium]